MNVIEGGTRVIAIEQFLKMTAQFLFAQSAFYFPYSNTRHGFAKPRRLKSFTQYVTGTGFKITKSCLQGLCVTSQT